MHRARGIGRVPQGHHPQPPSPQGTSSVQRRALRPRRRGLAALHKLAGSALGAGIFRAPGRCCDRCCCSPTVPRTACEGARCLRRSRAAGLKGAPNQRGPFMGPTLGWRWSGVSARARRTRPLESSDCRAPPPSCEPACVSGSTSSGVITEGAENHARRWGGASSRQGPQDRMNDSGIARHPVQNLAQYQTHHCRSQAQTCCGEPLRGSCELAPWTSTHLLALVPHCCCHCDARPTATDV